MNKKLHVLLAIAILISCLFSFFTLGRIYEKRILKSYFYKVTINMTGAIYIPNKYFLMRKFNDGKKERIGNIIFGEGSHWFSKIADELY